MNKRPNYALVEAKDDVYFTIADLVGKVHVTLVWNMS